MDGVNIYKIARESAGFTQEKWAEMLGTSVHSVQRYESGLALPPDEKVAMMSTISGMTVLGLWHIQHRSEIAAQILPEVRHLSLAEATVQLVCAIANIKDDEREILDMAADGKISGDEVLQWDALGVKLDAVVRAALQLKYANREG